MFVTLLVSQDDISWLNDVSVQNIYLMFVTLLVSQDDIS